MIKKRLEAIGIAFSMYSKLPMPQILWDEQNQKHAIAFFPLVGMALALFMYASSYLLRELQVGISLSAVVLSVVPIFFTGGIHMDGFLDTMDALSSWQTKEKRLEILKDPRSGAFAVMSAVIYFLMSYGLWQEILINHSFHLILGLSFVFSRAMTGLLLLFMPKARDYGLAKTFSKDGKNWETLLTLFLFLFFVIVVLFSQGIPVGLLFCLTQLIFVLCFVQKMRKEFGGITGDLCGFYLQSSELLSLLLFVFLRGALS